MNGSVCLAVSTLRENLCAQVILSFVGCAYVGFVQVSVMFDSSHYLKIRAETVSKLRLHPSLILVK